MGRRRQTLSQFSNPVAVPLNPQVRLVWNRGSPLSSGKVGH